MTSRFEQDHIPAVRAILNAYRDASWAPDTEDPNKHYKWSHKAGLAAALRAAADQVAPSDADEPRNYLPMAIECQRIRAELLAIAAELEARP
jgi:hypothetical protein